MIRKLSLGLMFSAVAFSQSLRMADVVTSIPLFQYPTLARIARIQGHIEMLVNVKDGKILSVTPPTGQKEFRIVQLSQPTLPLVQKMEFKSTATGECTIHFFFRLGLPSYDSKPRITIDPQENVVIIEANEAKATICNAPPK